MAGFSPTQTLVLEAARANGGVVPAKIAGVDPRALGGAVRGLVAAGALLPCPKAEGAYVKGDGSYRLPKPIRAKVGVMVASYHSRYMAQGGGSADTLDLAMRDAFLTRVTEHADKPQLDVAALRAWGESLGLWNVKWDSLNPGMMRMNLTNRVRAHLRKGNSVNLHGQVIGAAG